MLHCKKLLWHCHTVTKVFNNSCLSLFFRDGISRKESIFIAQKYFISAATSSEVKSNFAQSGPLSINKGDHWRVCFSSKVMNPFGKHAFSKFIVRVDKRTGAVLGTEIITDDMEI